MENTSGQSQSYEEVEFFSNSSRLYGRFFCSNSELDRAPAVVLGHGWSMITGGDIDRTAQRFADHGLSALAFDYQNLGRSGGTPRQEINPFQQVDDLINAISYLQTRDDVDGDRIGLWGSSYSGGHALVTAAVDKRIQAVVAQTPTISPFEGAKISGSSALWKAQLIDEDRIRRINGEAPITIQQVSDDPQSLVAYPGAASYNYMMNQASLCPAWRNEVTIRSLELAMRYEPQAFLTRISPTPILMIIAEGDQQVPPSLQHEAFESLKQPKDLLVVPGGHYGVYQEQFETVTMKAIEFMSAKLSD